MNEAELKRETKCFALRVLRLARALPSTVDGQAIARQIVRSGTSVGANYRSACRARSRADFIAKLAIVEEEADETAFWLELISDSGMLPAAKVDSLLDEADRLVAIMVKSRLSARASQSGPPSEKQKAKSEKG